MTYLRGIVEETKAGNFTLAAADNSKRFVVTAAITITAPAVGTLGNGFQCDMVNDSGGTVTIDGPGATNSLLDAGDIATVVEMNGKQRVVRGASALIS